MTPCGNLSPCRGYQDEQTAVLPWVPNSEPTISHALIHASHHNPLREPLWVLQPVLSNIANKWQNSDLNPDRLESWLGYQAPQITLDIQPRGHQLIRILTKRLQPTLNSCMGNLDLTAPVFSRILRNIWTSEMLHSMRTGNTSKYLKVLFPIALAKVRFFSF